MKLSSCFASFSMLALSAVASAAPHAAPHGAEGHAADPAASGPMVFTLLQFGSAIVVFLIVFAVLSIVVWPKILKGLEAREKKIRSEIFAAEEARKQAQLAQENFKREIEATRVKAQEEIENARAQASRIAADLKARAEIELNETREHALRSIEAAKRAAVNELYAEAATLATSVAGKILKREVSVSDQQRLVEETMGEVAARYAQA